MTKTKAVAIDVFSDVAGHISIGGVEHVVKHLNGIEYRKIQDLDSLPILEGYEIIARIVPTLGDAVYTLTSPQVGHVLTVALGIIKAVEEQFPNGDGAPATSESQAPPV